MRRAGIAGFTFHDLRHTAASWMRRAGVPLEDVQHMLGHADIRTTQRYAHIGDDATAKAAAALARKLDAIDVPATAAPPAAGRDGATAREERARNRA